MDEMIAADDASMKRREASWRKLCDEVLEELKRAIAKNGELVSVHEGYAVLLEEVDEYWDSIKENRADRHELVQIAAMALKNLELIDYQTRVEAIACPACGLVQRAVVLFHPGDPFPTYIHECTRCGYIIMESEWNVVTQEMVACWRCGMQQRRLPDAMREDGTAVFKGPCLSCAAELARDEG